MALRGQVGAIWPAGDVEEAADVCVFLSSVTICEMEDPFCHRVAAGGIKEADVGLLFCRLDGLH
jgi:hypothetical protein